MIPDPKLRTVWTLTAFDETLEAFEEADDEEERSLVYEKDADGEWRHSEAPWTPDPNAPRPPTHDEMLEIGQAIKLETLLNQVKAVSEHVIPKLAATTTKDGDPIIGEAELEALDPEKAEQAATVTVIEAIKTMEKANGVDL